MSRNHDDVAGYAAKAFTDHRLKAGPGLSWRMAKPGTGHYAYRITWAPGMLAISGDLGEATWSVWAGFATLWGAIDLVHGAGYDYLTGKCNAEQAFDRDATVATLLRCADEEQRYADDAPLWASIIRRYMGDVGNPRNGALQMQAAAELRQDLDIDAGEAYRLAGDGEICCYNYKRQTRWHYEALQLWARTMVAREPAWHRQWRRLRAEIQRVRALRPERIHRQPALYRPPDGIYNGSRWWTRKGDRWIALQRLKAFGLDLSRLGLWYAGGGQHSDDGRDRYVRVFA